MISHTRVIDQQRDLIAGGFDPEQQRFQIGVAGQIGGENAEFKFSDPSSPTLVLDPTDPGAQYVLMPLRV